MNQFILGLSIAILCLAPSYARAQDTYQNKILSSVEVEGGPILTRHIQSGDEDFRDTHQLAIVKIHTEDYGNWGVLLLTPNSVNRTSVGVGYVTDPFSLPVGPFSLELSGGLGLVTGYQDYPVPLIEGEARLVLYSGDRWDAGLTVAALPYIMEDDRDDRDHDNHFGVVVTSPFLSARYKF